jgi:hypothetical protein
MRNRYRIDQEGNSMRLCVFLAMGYRGCGSAGCGLLGDEHGSSSDACGVTAA